MVILHVKRENESCFLFDTKLDILVENVTKELIEIYNGCLKVKRLCSEIDSQCDHIIAKPINTCADIEENDLESIHTKGCEDTEVLVKNSIKYINLREYEEKKVLLNKIVSDARGIVSKEQTQGKFCLTIQHVQDALTILRGGIDDVFLYSCELPKNSLIKCLLEEREILFESSDGNFMLHPTMTSLWFSGKVLQTDKKLSDYFGKNEKTKVVVKLHPLGSYAPAKEPLLTDEEKNFLLLSEFKRREEQKKLQDEDDSYLDSEWADNNLLKKSFHGIKNITWKN